MARLEREGFEDPSKFLEAEKFRDSIYNFNSGSKDSVRCKVFEDKNEQLHEAFLEHDSAASSPHNVYNNDFTYLGRRQRVKYTNLNHAKTV